MGKSSRLALGHGRVLEDLRDEVRRPALDGVHGEGGVRRCVEIKFRAPHAKTRYFLRSCVCSMVTTP